MSSSLKLPTIAGIKVYIHWTFSILIVWIVYNNIRAGLDSVQILWSVLFILSLFLCVTLHELGHALAAKRYGIKTKDITLYPIGGVARLERMPENPKHELIVALAGPLVNVIIMILLLPLILNHNFNNESNESALLISQHNFLPMLGVINIWLALFNLIPAFPMDGGRVLRALLSMRMSRVRATEIASQIGKGLAIGFVFLGFYINPFLIFIGLFIILGAHSEFEMVKSQYLLTDLRARDALMTQFSSLEANSTIGDAIKKLLDTESTNFVITENGIPLGFLTRDHIIKGISHFGESSEIRSVAEMRIVKVNLNKSLNEIMEEFQKKISPLIFVYEGDDFKGVIDYENISEIIMINNARLQARIAGS
ncbi:MAG: site-2 protease family protein [Saprospiraceae bacterium]|nr:site-2 protease family protein [Saprospiraceae bacterium]